MEIFRLDQDITIFCIRATSYPAGIRGAHEVLRSKIPFTQERLYFGISHPIRDEGIVYWAGAAELKAGDLAHLQAEKFIARKGVYAFLDVHNFLKDPTALRNAFKKLLTHSSLDPQGACVEWYQGVNDVKCMVRLQD